MSCNSCGISSSSKIQFITHRFFQVSGLASDVDEFNDVVENYKSGTICGIKHVLADGNVSQRSSLVACTDVEMLEFNLKCTHEAFYDILKTHPIRYVHSTHYLLPTLGAQKYLPICGAIEYIKTGNRLGFIQ